MLSFGAGKYRFVYINGLLAQLIQVNVYTFALLAEMCPYTDVACYDNAKV